MAKRAHTTTAGFDTRVIDLEDFDASEMASIPLAVYCIATYGEGDPTDSATNFVGWVKNSDGDLAEDALAHMSFAVFGLGNTQYEVSAWIALPPLPPGACGPSAASPIV